MAEHPERDRITGKKFFSDLLKAIDVERGFLYNIKALIRFPGLAIRAYLDGDKTKLLNPFKYFLSSIFLSILSFWLVQKLDPDVVNETEAQWDNIFSSDITTYGSGILTILLLALLVTLIKRKSDYNFFENLIGIIFLFSTYIIIEIPVEFILIPFPDAIYFAPIIPFIYIIWAIKDTFKMSFIVSLITVIPTYIISYAIVGLIIMTLLPNEAKYGYGAYSGIEINIARQEDEKTESWLNEIWETIEDADNYINSPIIIESIHVGSPASTTNLSIGDTILTMNGEKQSYLDFDEYLLYLKPGDTLTLTVLQKGDSLDIPIVLGTKF